MDQTYPVDGTTDNMNAPPSSSRVTESVHYPGRQAYRQQRITCMWLVCGNCGVLPRPVDINLRPLLSRQSLRRNEGDIRWTIDNASPRMYD